jgi:DNA-binding GntR family transcriptional regulator
VTPVRARERAKPPIAAAKQTDADDAYVELRRHIRTGALAPGERLVETEIADRLGLGRNAVRTSLARLEQDGLVERAPYRGARVRVIGETEAVEILEARAVLEGLAARYAARRATPRDVKALRAILLRMRQRLAAGDLLGLSELNAELHRRILATARLPMVAKLIDDLKTQNVRHQFRTVLAPGRPPRSLREHRAIVDAIAGGDPDAAEATMREHLAQVVGTLHSLATRSATP